MSHHTRITTRIANPDAAAAALRDLYPGATVDVDASGKLRAALYGTQTADHAVAVARKIGWYGEDVAIVRNADGTCQLVADVSTIAECERRIGRPMPAEVARRAAYHTILGYARASGLDVVSDSTQQAATVAAGAGRVG